jgi:hypothetical protein
VPENVDEGDLRRDLANKGYHVVRTHFEHDTIKNTRTGRGFVQVRAANPRCQEHIEKEIKQHGVQVAAKQLAQPNLNLRVVWND